MSRPLVVVVLVFSAAVLSVTLAAQNLQPTRSPTPQPHRKQNRQAYREEITRLLNDETRSSLDCSADADCEAIAIGSRPCGGPAEYVVLNRTTKTRFQNQLRDLQEAIAELDQLRNKESGTLGVCVVLEKPTLHCRSSLCVSSSGASSRINSGD